MESAVKLTVPRNPSRLKLENCGSIDRSGPALSTLQRPAWENRAAATFLPRLEAMAQSNFLLPNISAVLPDTQDPTEPCKRSVGNTVEARHPAAPNRFYLPGARTLSSIGLDCERDCLAGLVDAGQRPARPTERAGAALRPWGKLCQQWVRP